MNPHTSIIDTANGLAVRKLILHLVPPFESFVENGVTIFVTPTWNRFGVPRHGAQTWRFTFRADDWEMVVRAVFHKGKLLEPLATHCVVELYDGVELGLACQRANNWLKNLDL